MQDFSLYFSLGWQHILDWNGYDHILFVLALCGVYSLMDWKKMLILVTAFTVGHSITLALSVLSFVKVNTAMIELLIPVTIMVTALSNLKRKNRRGSSKSAGLRYMLPLCFGFIHGLGFSSYLKSLLGKTTNIVPQLMAFNLGLEFGQLIIVLGGLLISFILINLVKIRIWDWNFFLSSAIFGIAFIMTAQRVSVFL